MGIYKTYTIQKINSDLMFIMPKDYRGIDYVLSSVNKELRAKHYKGFVIFDLLLSNGNNSSRFFRTFFDGQKIKNDTVMSVYPAPKEFITLSNKFLKRHPEILSRGVLTSIDIQRIQESL